MDSPDEPLHIVAPAAQFVSRAGHKLDGALDVFGVDVQGRTAIDVGASTGGFTDCLLQRGAASVVALDVGYGQLHERLRTDDRVTVVERTNVRHADALELGAPFSIVVADLSFISLRTVALALASLGDDSTDWLLLVKPQFEAGRDAVGRGGIVRESSIWTQVLFEVHDGLSDVGLGCHGLEVSSIRGSEGNVEFVGYYRKAPGIVTAEQIDDVVRAAS